MIFLAVLSSVLSSIMMCINDIHGIHAGAVYSATLLKSISSITLSASAGFDSITENEHSMLVDRHIVVIIVNINNSI